MTQPTIPSPERGDMTIREFQQFIRDQYYARDSERGTAGTFHPCTAHPRSL